MPTALLYYGEREGDSLLAWIRTAENVSKLWTEFLLENNAEQQALAWFRMN